MNAGGRSHDNYLYGRVTKVTKVANIQFGVNYENKVNAERKRQGQSADFVAGGLHGCEWVSFPCIIRSLKDGKMQMRVTCTANTKFNTEYFVDGRKATSEEIEVINKYTPKRDSIEVFNITIEKIVRWKINGQEFVDADITEQIETYRAAV